MDILEELFGSQARLRIMRLFFKNEDEPFSKKAIVKRTELQEPKVRRELNILTKIQFLKERKIRKEKIFELNQNFIFFKELKEIIDKAEFVPDKKMVSTLKRIGKVKFAIISGELINEKKAEADILVVCDDMNEKKFMEFVKSLEADVGVELRYATMTEKEFMYRCDMFDRFTIEMLRSPHRELINTIPRLPKQLLKASKTRR